MVNSGVVGNAATSVSSSLNSYSTILSGLSGSWNGTSYDSIIKNQANSFLSEYQSIVGQINSFQNAVENYEKYIEQKRKKEACRTWS